LTEDLIDFHANGVKQVSAKFKKNKLSGAWKSWYPTGAICDSGRFTGNVPDGLWKSWYPDGNPRYIWHFNARKLAAVKDELLRQPKNKMYVIAGKPVPEAVKHFRTDHWSGSQQPARALVLRTQLVNPPTFSRDELMERVVANTEGKGDKYTYPFSEALLHGNFTAFYPDGQVKEDGVYINGLREGAWEAFLMDGTRIRGSYYHGQHSGEWRYYNKEGKLISLTRYKNNGEIAEQHAF
jgi:antitoxin component YwqK of YwqJK toxin-antitoxin module